MDNTQKSHDISALPKSNAYFIVKYHLKSDLHHLNKLIIVSHLYLWFESSMFI